MKTIPSISVDAQILTKRLTEAEPGETITYKQLSELIGRSIQNGARGILTTARNRAFSDSGIHFSAVRGVGIRRSDDKAKIDAAESRISRIRSQSRKGIKEAASVDNYAEMSKDDQVRHNVTLSVLGALNQATSQKCKKALEKAASEANAQIPVAKTLELFKS